MANPSGRNGSQWEKMELKLIHSGTFYKGVTKGRMGPHYPDKPYNVGTVHRAVVDTNLRDSCAPGIHVCLTIAEALRWGPVVVEVGVPEDATIVVAAKVRVGPSVKVLARDVQVGADLWGTNLWGTDLRDARLWGANFRGANFSSRGNERTILPTGYEVTSSGLMVRK